MTKVMIIDDGGDDEDDAASLDLKKCYRMALQFRRRGFNVVPCSPTNKRPAIEWKKFQDRLVTDEEMLSHYGLYAGGVGVITGQVSGVINIESDGPEGEAVLQTFAKTHGLLPDTFTVRSGSGRGLHRYFKHPGFYVPTRANPSIKLDVKGDRGFCVLPPSRHKSGGQYEIVLDVTPAHLPVELLAFIEAAASKEKGAPSTPSDPRTAGTTHSNAERGLGENTNAFERLPVNLVNVAIIMTMLDAQPDSFTSDYTEWLKVGFALHDFDEGEVGLALWKKFSDRCPDKAANTDFAALWGSFDTHRPDGKVTLGSLWNAAKQHGWRPSRSWDRSTTSVYAGTST